MIDFKDVTFIIPIKFDSEDRKNNFKITSFSLKNFKTNDLKNTIETWTGISVSIGAAPNKVLSKVANRLAKKNKQATGCVVVLDSIKKVQTALQQTPIEDVWGIGFQYSQKLKLMIQ